MIESIFLFFAFFVFFLIVLFIVRVWRCVRLVNEVCEKWLELHVTKDNGNPHGSSNGS